MKHSKQGDKYLARFITMNDGVRIYVRDYCPDNPVGPTCIILSGLTRNSKDGHNLATQLATHKTYPCRVISMDYRGRGKSDYCDYKDYTVPREALDTAEVMTALNIHKGVIIGTSRGGMIAMALGAMRPGLLSGVVLNDIGPELEAAGLKRIMSYVGVKPHLETFKDATIIVKAVNPGFNLSEQEWRDMTYRLFRDAEGKPEMDYDPDLALSFKAMKPKPGEPIPTMWKQFETLKHIPLLIIRGENSDLFSDRLMRDMAICHGNAYTLTVKDRGHAPFLDEPGILPKIIKLLKWAI